MNLPLSLSWLWGLALATVLPAQDPADFDRDRDGRLDRAERQAFFLHRLNLSFSQLDTDRDGTVSASELDRAREQTELNDLDLERRYGVREAYSLPEIRRYLAAAPERAPSARRFPVQLRQSHEIRSFSAARPALLSYARDFASEENEWSARGALLAPVRLRAGGAPARQRLVLSELNLVPSIAFQRVANDRNTRREADSLIFRLGLDAQLAGGPLDLQQIRFQAAYATDFGFRSRVGALEADWEPTILGLGFGVFRSLIPGAVEFRLQGHLHAEGGEVFRTGGKPGLRGRDDFFRLGPRLGLELRPAFYDRLRFDLGWRYLYGPAGSPQHSRHWEAGMIWQLDPAGHFNFTVSYENGRLPLVQDETESMQVGLGVKF